MTQALTHAIGHPPPPGPIAFTKAWVICDLWQSFFLTRLKINNYYWTIFKALCERLTVAKKGNSSNDEMILEFFEMCKNFRSMTMSRKASTRFSSSLTSRQLPDIVQWCHKDQSVSQWSSWVTFLWVTSNTCAVIERLGISTCFEVGPLSVSPYCYIVDKKRRV